MENSPDAQAAPGQGPPAAQALLQALGLSGSAFNLRSRDAEEGAAEKRTEDRRPLDRGRDWKQRPARSAKVNGLAFLSSPAKVSSKPQVGALASR